MLTPITYPGGKSRMASKIVDRIGPHRFYVEPFCGTASVFYAKPRAWFELLNDRDEWIVTMLRVLRDRPEELAHALSLTPYSRAEYLAADPAAADDDLEVARRVAVRIGQSFAKAGVAEPSVGWKISMGGGRSCAATWSDVPRRIVAAIERLQGVHIENVDALTIIERYGNEPDAVLYVDPPYLGDVRSTRRFYRHEMKDQERHEALADLLRCSPAHVLLSGYHSPLYDRLYGDWDREEFAAVANNNGGAVKQNVMRTEVLWSNRPYDRAATLFDPVPEASVVAAGREDDR